jgi:hypothetical protein
MPECVQLHNYFGSKRWAGLSCFNSACILWATLKFSKLAYKPEMMTIFIAQQK